ncbi:hypothetical protein D3C72_2225090 [compost metagenome]
MAQIGQHRRADQAAPEHHVDRRLAGLQHEPADRAGHDHGQGHVENAAFDDGCHGRLLSMAKV